MLSISDQFLKTGGTLLNPPWILLHGTLVLLVFILISMAISQLWTCLTHLVQRRA